MNAIHQRQIQEMNVPLFLFSSSCIFYVSYDNINSFSSENRVLSTFEHEIYNWIYNALFVRPRILDYNDIEYIDDDAFIGLSSLRIL